MGQFVRGDGARLKRGEVWWADLGSYPPREQTGRRPVVIWQSDTLTQALESVLVVPLTTNLDRARLAGTALISSSSVGRLSQDSVALAFQMRAIPKSALKTKIRISTRVSLKNWSWQPTRRWDASSRLSGA